MPAAKHKEDSQLLNISWPLKEELISNAVLGNESGISPVAFLAASLWHWQNALPIKQCMTNTLNGYIRGDLFLTVFPWFLEARLWD